jgi:hypothetical protein
MLAAFRRRNLDLSEETFDLWVEAKALDFVKVNGEWAVRFKSPPRWKQ